VQHKPTAGHPLFAGARHTPWGIEVRLVDRFRALQAIGRILGVFNRPGAVRDDGETRVLEACRDIIRKGRAQGAQFWDGEETAAEGHRHG
jgi:hypothetical protein